MSSRRSLSENEQAVLELLALSPVTYFPALPLRLAERLRRRGYAVRRRGRWYLTRAGISQIGHKVH